MQIASTRKGCACDKCEAGKENDFPEDAPRPTTTAAAAVATRGGGNSGPSSSLARSSRQTQSTSSRLRARLGNSSGAAGGQHPHQQHRLDHTYAATSNGLEAKSNGKAAENRRGAGGRSMKEESDEELGLKSTWLRNLCLEYQGPSARPSCDLDSTQQKDRLPRLGYNGLGYGQLKQYQRNRKMNSTKELPTTYFGKNKIIKSVQEDKKRWIAALALIELAQSK